MKTLRILISMLLLLMITPFHTNAKGTFIDVLDNHRVKTETHYLTSKEIMNGLSEGTSKLNERMNQADAAAVMATVLQLELDSTNQINFNDVNSDHIYYKEIQAMIANQIITGFKENLFKPSGNITRAELASFLIKAVKLMENASLTKEKGNQFELEVLKLTNEARLRHGLPALKRDTRVEEIARKKSEDMRDKDYFSHTSPTYGSPFDMLKSLGITYRYAGENIAAGQETPSEVVDAWMNSKGHRENILSPNYTHLAVGYAKGGSYRHYWTQMFTSY